MPEGGDHHLIVVPDRWVKAPDRAVAIRHGAANASIHRRIGDRRTARS
jgi:hypothetical protein